MGFSKDPLQDHMAHQVTGHAVVVFMQMEYHLVATVKANSMVLRAGSSLAWFSRGFLHSGVGKTQKCGN